MNLSMLLYMAILFVVLVPGLVLRLPSKGSLVFAAIVHALVFVVLYSLITHYTEGFDGPSGLNPISCKNGSIKIRFEDGTPGTICAYSLPKGDFCRTDAFCQSKSCNKSKCM